MTTITKTIAILCAVLLAACGGGDDAEAVTPADAEVRTAVCPLPSDQSAVRNACGVLLDLKVTSITVEYLGAVAFDNQAADAVNALRSFSIKVNGAVVKTATVSASVPAASSIGDTFSVKASLDLAALTGAQIAEVTFASASAGGGSSRIAGLTRVAVVQR